MVWVAAGREGGDVLEGVVFVREGVVVLDFVLELDCLVFFFLVVVSFFSGVVSFSSVGVEIFCCCSGSSAMAANESAAAIESAYNAESIARLSTSQESSHKSVSSQSLPASLAPWHIESRIPVPKMLTATPHSMAITSLLVLFPDVFTL